MGMYIEMRHCGEWNNKISRSIGIQIYIARERNDFDHLFERECFWEKSCFKFLNNSLSYYL